MIRNKCFKEKYGEWALVAGASEGLGAAFAEEAAKRGLNLILLARRKELLDDLALVLTQKYRIDVICYKADLSDYNNTKSTLEAITQPIGLLIYNAAFVPIGYFNTNTEEQLIKAVDVNVKAPLLIAKFISEKMIANKKGGIILMSSLTCMQGTPKVATYAATKAFNHILAEGLWQELKEHKIDVVASCAGAIITPGYNKAQNGKAPGTMQASVVAEKTLNALGKTPMIIPGIINKAARFILVRLLPRKTAIKLMYNNTKSLS